MVIAKTVVFFRMVRTSNISKFVNHVLAFTQSIESGVLCEEETLLALEEFCLSSTCFLSSPDPNLCLMLFIPFFFLEVFLLARYASLELIFHLKMNVNLILIDL